MSPHHNLRENATSQSQGECLKRVIYFSFLPRNISSGHTVNKFLHAFIPVADFTKQNYDVEVEGRLKERAA